MPSSITSFRVHQEYTFVLLETKKYQQALEICEKLLAISAFDVDTLLYLNCPLFILPPPLISSPFSHPSSILLLPFLSSLSKFVLTVKILKVDALKCLGNFEEALKIVTYTLKIVEKQRNSSFTNILQTQDSPVYTEQQRRELLVCIVHFCMCCLEKWFVAREIEKQTSNRTFLHTQSY